MKSFPLIQLTFLSALMLIVGCGGSSDNAGGDGDAPVIAFVQTGADNDWRNAHTVSVKEAAADKGYDLRFAEGQSKQENQIKAFSSFVNQGVDAIILAPIVETGWDNVLEKAKKRNIPVVILDRKVNTDDESLYVTYIGADTYTEGKKAGKWLAEKMGGQAKVVELQGNPGASPTINRFNGFREAIADQSGIEIIASQSGEFRRSKGKEVMEAFLKKYGDEIDAVYAHNDDMAIGAIQAIEDAGMKPAEDIVIVSVDGVRAAFEAMVDGKLNCTVECNPLQGPLAMEAVEKILSGQADQLDKVTLIEDSVFEMEQAADVIESRKY
ncbi:ABC transporter substrate-binding protein [Crateriforma conspicua]|uniref:ABC transporter periplasmic-binding protein YtfQ n=1 Tax=Crateriforma conspicua TaxID=2527996 RepID=A0A5C5Y2B4_9PLAN|nr:ABC transporter substrate-binding protein [Crateriforma conspicua]QDV63947.1 ABC transporter periplasmic-binding protein YtfQ precursor [Crateriforma conspicua]TWT69310.1 ABC transporter periplasmic-binding protein YtfQ precursor [Crateriforma conspicua]